MKLFNLVFDGYNLKIFFPLSLLFESTFYHPMLSESFIIISVRHITWLKPADINIPEWNGCQVCLPHIVNIYGSILIWALCQIGE
jgi:hypothetical protein